MTLDSERDPIEQIYEIASRAVRGLDGSTPAVTRFQNEVRFFLDETGDVDAALSVVIEVGEELGLIQRESNGQFKPHKSSPSPAENHKLAVPEGTRTCMFEAGEGDEEDLVSDASEGAMVSVSDTSPTNSAEDQLLSVSRDRVGRSDAEQAEGKDHVATVAQATTRALSDLPPPFPNRSSRSQRPPRTAPAGPPPRSDSAAAIYTRKMGTGREIGSYRYSELRSAELASKKGRAHLPQSAGIHRPGARHAAG